MRYKNDIFNAIKKSIPILIIVLASFASLYLLFINGVFSGDDLSFHASQVYDLVYGFNHGSFFLKPNHIAMGAFSYYAYGYYGPLSHYSAAIFTFLFQRAGASTIDGIKFTMITFVTIGNIFFYLIANYFIKNKKTSLVVALIYAFAPYITFCALCRFAFGEVIALSLVPVIYYGIIRIFNDEKRKVFPYFVFTISTFFLCLTHAFTLLMVATSGVIYLLFNIKKFIKLIRNKTKLISCFISVSAIFLMSFFYLIPTIYYQRQNLYVVSDDTLERTTLSFLMNSTKTSYIFSGFFKSSYFLSQIEAGTFVPKYGINTFYIVWLTSISSALVSILLDQLVFKKYTKLYIWIRIIISGIITFVPSIFVGYTICSLFALIIFFISYIFFIFNDNEQNEKSPLSNKTDIIYPLVMVVLLTLLIFYPDIWKIMPSIYRKCQFAWRLFGLFYFFIALFIIQIARLIKFKAFSQSFFLIFASSMLIFSQSLNEKQILLDNKNWRFDGYDESNIKSVYRMGWLNEFVPKIYSSDYKEKYQSEYGKSLYTRVYKALNSGKTSDYIYDIDDFYYAFLQGNGSLEVSKLNTPNLEFTLEVTSDTALIQIPKFYYEGYYLKVKKEDGTVRTTKVENIDSLVSFNLEQGKYTCSITFKGTNYYRIGLVLLPLGVILTSSLFLLNKYFKKIDEGNLAINKAKHENLC